MNICICTDLEGVSGVRPIEAVSEVGSPAYAEAIERLMADTNAAVRAAFDCGAEKVFVVDGHGSGKNFIQSALDPRATQIAVKDMGEGVKNSAAMVVIGQHAMAGTENAFLDHTESSVLIHHWYYNGKRVGELMMTAVFAGHFGVPVVALSGDRAACLEAQVAVAGISTAEVKSTTRRNVAECLMENKQAEKTIYDAVRRGIERRADIQPVRIALPLTVTVEYNRSDYCEKALARNPKLERVDAYTVREIKREIPDDYYGIYV